MAEQMTVDTGGLRETARQVGARRSRAEALARTAAGAAVTPGAWGLVGLATLYPSYVSSLATTTEHLGKLATALSDASDTLTAVAEIYEQAERGLVQVITDAAAALAQAPTAPTVRA